MQICRRSVRIFINTEGERFFSQKEKRLKEYGGMPLAGGVGKFFRREIRGERVMEVCLWQEVLRGFFVTIKELATCLMYP